jgi:hypothetical protein
VTSPSANVVGVTVVPVALVVFVTPPNAAAGVGLMATDAVVDLAAVPAAAVVGAVVGVAVAVSTIGAGTAFVVIVALDGAFPRLVTAPSVAVDVGVTTVSAFA